MNHRNRSFGRSFGLLALDGPYQKRRRPVPWVPILIYSAIIVVGIMLIRSLVCA